MKAEPERLIHFERAFRALRRRGLNFDVHLHTSHLTLSQNKLSAGDDGIIIQATWQVRLQWLRQMNSHLNVSIMFEIRKISSKTSVKR